MDISKLQHIQDKLNQESVAELLENIPPPFLQFSNSPTIQLNLSEVKTGRKVDQSARVLHNWIQQEVIDVDSTDKGRINRFSRLESIWLNIVIEARKFGLPLESLKQARKELFGEPIPNFSILKFYVLDSILRKPKTLLISEGGHTNILSLDSYSKWVSTGLLHTHLSFNLSEFILPEYPKQSFNKDFSITEPYQDINKCKLLYYLKTGDYNSIKVYITATDIRLIEDSATLLENTELIKTLKQWEFLKAVVVTSSNVEDVINCRL